MRVPSRRELRIENLETRTLLASDAMGAALQGDIGRSPQVDAHTTTSAATPGDANGDGSFDQLDLVQVLLAGKYLTGDRATFAEGDWNADGLFDQHDLVFALESGQYGQPHAIPFSAHGGRPLSASLSGSEEVPGPGDPDGSGSAELTLNQGQGRICFEIEVADIAEPTAAHIHVGAAGISGGVVVDFDVDNNGLTGCVDVDKDLVKAVRQDPGSYYVNVHNADFPPGAIRGQLSK